MMNDFCFVIQPFDHGKFDKRYFDIIKPVVESFGLQAYRVDEDFDVEIPINAIETKISGASLVIAEITTDNPNVWYELGYAFARSKTVILLCSDERKTAFPFDVRHRNILTYYTDSLGSFEECRNKLKSFIASRYKSSTLPLEQDKITSEELFILKFISRDQKTSFAITSEEKILQGTLDQNSILDSLKLLIKKGYLEYRYSTTSGESYYHITDKAEKVMV